MEVGFLGLGIMGKAMSMNLLRHGFKVTVWNRTLSKVFPLSFSALCFHLYIAFFFFSRLMFGCFSAYGSAKRLYFDVVLYACLDASLLMVVEKDWILMLLALGKIMWCPCHAPKEVLFGEMIAVLLTVLEDWVLVECLLILIRRMQCWRVKRDWAAWGFVSVYSLLCTSYWIIEVLLAITS